MLLYHGTTPQAAEAIKQGETLKPANASIWTCSDGDEYLYFWSPADLLACGEADEPEDACDRALSNALESAHTQAAVQEVPQTAVQVLVFWVDDDHIEPDTSCENMEGSGAVRVQETAPRKLIAVYEEKHNPRLDAIHAMLLLSNDHAGYLPEDVREAAEALQGADVYIEPENNAYLIHGHDCDIREYMPTEEHAA